MDQCDFAIFQFMMSFGRIFYIATMPLVAVVACQILNFVDHAHRLDIKHGFYNQCCDSRAPFGAKTWAHIFFQFPQGQW